MRLTAKIILPIILLIHGSNFIRGLSIVDWTNIGPWINWLAIWLGILGVGIYAFNLYLWNAWIWRLILGFILFVDASHLHKSGLYATNSSSLVVIVTTIKYAILVLPQIVAVVLLSLQRNVDEIKNVA